jgi:3-methylcrotonyl-CoA carboxylase alpha subunit
MIAKLILRGHDRQEAISKLHSALTLYEIAGPSTNVEFLKKVCKSPAFIAGQVETGFIPKHHEELFKPVEVPSEVFAQAAIGILLRDSAQLCGDGLSGNTGFTSGPRGRVFEFEHGSDVGGSNAALTRVLVNQTADKTFDVDTDLSPGGSTTQRFEAIRSNYAPLTNLVSSLFPQARFDSTIIFPATTPLSGAPTGAVASPSDAQATYFLTIFHLGTQYRLRLAPPKFLAKALGSKDLARSVMAPMPCKVLRVDVAPGQEVDKDQVLVVVESMKMETTIKSPQKGKISRIVHAQGDLVKAGTALVEFEEEGERDEADEK